MSKTVARRLAVALFAVYTLAVTWPVATFFSAPAPLVLGLPLSLAWPVGWIVVGWITLLVLDAVEQRGGGE